MGYFFICLIALSLSMDAFSLALSIGTMRLPSKVTIGLSLTVGVFHFVMPTIGTILGSAFVQGIHMDAHILSGSIFFYIAIVMFKDFRNGEEANFKLSLVGAFLFALGVSLDSFGVGFALTMNVAECVKSFLIFSGFSATFTFLGLNLGSMLSSLVGEYSVLVGSVIMAILSILNFCQFLL